jgi:hypothetical protein
MIANGHRSANCKISSVFSTSLSKGNAMISVKSLLIASSLAALPAIAAAAPTPPMFEPLAPVVVVAPVATPSGATLMPTLVPAAVMPMPVAVLQQMALLQSQMVASLAAWPTLSAVPMSLPPGAHGMMQVSMVSTGSPGGVCSEQMQIERAPNGQMRVLVHRSGNACGPLPAALPAGAGTAPAEPAPGAPGALPPPSGLTYASYHVPPKTMRPAQQG